MLEEPRKESRGRDPRPPPALEGAALPTSSAWLEKVVSKALGHGEMQRGPVKGRHLIYHPDWGTCGAAG